MKKAPDDRYFLVTVRPAQPNKAKIWYELRHTLWPRVTRNEQDEDIEDFIAGCSRYPLAVLLAERRYDPVNGSENDGDFSRIRLNAA